MSVFSGSTCKSNLTKRYLTNTPGLNPAGGSLAWPSSAGGDLAPANNHLLLVCQIAKNLPKFG